MAFFGKTFILIASVQSATDQERIVMGDPLASVSSTMQATTCPNKPVYVIVVDPDRAHLGESFVIDMRKMGSIRESMENKVDAAERETIALNLMRAANSEKPSKENPQKVGRVIANINEINHAHPANVVPSENVGPPTVKVFFDMPGLGSISFKYHKVLTLKDQIVFITDKRFGGPAEFYPYCNMRINEPKKPVGVYIEGEKKLFLLDPSVTGFPIKFECEPFELCVVPLGGSKDLNSAMIKELGIVNSFGGETGNGEESSNSGRANPSEQPGRSESYVDGDYESIEGGSGSVI